MIPAAPFKTLQQVAKSHSSAHSPAEYMSEIGVLLAELLPRLERDVAAATEGPAPLQAAAANLVLAGGKRVRPVTCLLMSRLFDASADRVVPLAAAVELIHSATLLHDDVMDEGEERRGRPASRVLWGNLTSVLAGDLLLTSALQLVLRAGVPGAMDDTLGTMQALIAGEVAQLKARGRDDLGIDGYLEIARGKTASLFACACRLGARAGSAPDEVVEAAGRFGDRVGIAFQIVDDVLDLEGVPHEVGKRLGHDLAEGKTTLPLALALNHASADLRPMLVDARAGDTVAAAKVSRAPAVRQACVEARAFAIEETETGLRELGALPDRRERALLEALVRGLTDRRT
jgi:octaprenyl-diphosphate synthase